MKPLQLRGISTSCGDAFVALFGDSLNEAFKMAAARLVVELTIGEERHDEADGDCAIAD